MVTLIVTDNTDGTGLTATIAGGLITDVWTVYVTSLTPGVLTFTTYGPRTGNGAVPVPVPNGPYVAYALADTGSVTNHVFVSATNRLASTATRLRQYVADAIAALGLPFVAIEQQWTPVDETNLSFPCVILTVENVQETWEGDMNLTDDIGYPVRVMICDKQDAYDHDTLPDYETWRQTIVDRFRNQQIPVGVNVLCRVEWDAIINPNLPKLMFVVSEFVVRGIFREPRQRA